jgi:hypothetical protein
MSDDETKKCTRCHEDLLINRFAQGKNGQGRSFTRAYCKGCEQRAKEARPSKVVRVPEPDGTYRCSCCKLTKPLNAFGLIRKGTAVDSRCRECWRESNRAAYIKRNPEARRQIPRELLTYEYAFARDFLGFGQEQIATWLGKTYDIEPETIRDYKLHTAPTWRPDEWKGDEE